MRACLWGIVVLLATSTIGSAADTPSPDQLKKMYEDSLVQLKSAQDRKNELAKENDNLKAKVEELSKQLAAAQTQSQDLKREVAENGDKTFYLRSYHAAWQNFLREHPEVMIRWQMFIEGDIRGNPQPMPALIDPTWPLSRAAEG